MTYATPSDVEVRLGRPASSAAETAQWQAWIDDAESIIRDGFAARGLDLDACIADGFPSVAAVIRVQCEAVLRRIANPDPGLTSVTRSIDDASFTTRREGPASDTLSPTDVEWGQLLPGAGDGAFSTRPGFEPDCRTDLDPFWVCP